MGYGRLGLVGLIAVATAGLSLASVERGIDPEPFTFEGQPIHPKLVEAFEGWPSDDGPPITVAVDVAAALDSNQYAGAIETTASGLVRARSGEGWFGYEHLGQMEDGTHVLRTVSSGGGSAVFSDLLFVRLRHDRVRDPDGVRRERLVMECTGRFDLGDRDEGTVEVRGDRVVVGPSRYRSHATTLDFGGS